MNNESLLLLAGLIAIFSSFVGTFAGGGSSLILLACLLYLFPETYLNHLALVKIAVVLQVVIASFMHRKRTPLEFSFVGVLIVTGILGTIVGTYLVQFVFSEQFLHLLLGLLMIGVALYLVLSPEIGLHNRGNNAFTNKEKIQAGIASFLFSILNALSGGMGFLFISYMIKFHRVSFIEATAYGMLSSVFIIGSQAIYLSTQVPLNLPLLACLLLGSAIGAYVGTHSQYAKGNRWVKTGATLVMLILGVQMLF